MPCKFGAPFATGQCLHCHPCSYHRQLQRIWFGVYGRRGAHLCSTFPCPSRRNIVYVSFGREAEHTTSKGQDRAKDGRPREIACAEVSQQPFGIKESSPWWFPWQGRVDGGAFFPQRAAPHQPSMRAISRFGGPIKTLVGSGPLQSTTTGDTMPTTTIPFTSIAAFTSGIGKPLQDVGHQSEQIG